MSTDPAPLPVDDLLRDRSGRIWRRTAFDRVAGWTLPLLFLVAIIPILDLVYWVASRALPTLTWTVLSTNPSGTGGGLYAPLVGTFEILAVATGVSVLLGLAGGIMTAEFLSERWATVVRTSANLLAGTPSVVVGYFGYLTFVLEFGWRLSLVAGAVTLAFFMTPYVFRSVDLAFSSVPGHLRDAALGSGAARSQYIGRVALPIAFPQVLTGVFLAMAIGVGETAPLVFTTGWSILPPTSLGQPAGYLTGLIWNYFQSIFAGQVTLAFQSALLLLIIVIGLNLVVRAIAAVYRKRLEGLFH